MGHGKEQPRRGSLQTPEELAEYAELLGKKVEDRRFPSNDLLARVDGLVTQLAATANRE